MEDPGLETIHVPIYLPECIRPDTDLGQELSSLILALTERLAPKFGVLMAADLAHFCIIEMDADEGLQLFGRLDSLSRRHVESVQNFLADSSND